LLDSYRRFPRDNEFIKQLKERDLYNTRSIKYALDKIENYNRKEKVNVDDYTIEHIMPQNPNLSLEWQEELGEKWAEIQNKYLHTIGNLTLTGYNSELSDNTFREKQNMKGGFKDSPIRLNAGLFDLKKWDDSAIVNRAEKIGIKSLKVWKLPAVEKNILSKYRVKYKGPSSKIPHNLIELIENESSIVRAGSTSASLKFKPIYLLDLKEKLIQHQIIKGNEDLLKAYLFYYEFIISTAQITFAFYIGDHSDQALRKRIYNVFTRFTHYFPDVDRKLRKHWHTVISYDLVTSEEYEMYADDENLDLFALIELRFREVIDFELPKINQAIDALVNSI